MKTPALLAAALLMLLVPGTIDACTDVPFPDFGDTHFTILVTNSVTHSPNKTYCTYVHYRGILLGGMRRLQQSTPDFWFTYTDNLDYGPFLESVNGVYGSDETYWELLVQTPDGEIIRPDLGIGCYLPNEDETIILNFTTIHKPSVRISNGEHALPPY